jgi:ComF family protein
MITKLLDLIFPPKCIFCGELISRKNNDETCLICRQNLPYCMSAELGDVAGDSFIRAVASFIYEGYVTDSIYRFKARGCQWYAKTYAKYLKYTIEHYYSDMEFDYIVSVPMTKKKLAERGYDQTRLIAEYLNREIDVPYLSDAMKKVKETPKQQGLSQAERKYNLAGVFEVAKAKEIEGKTLLLIDDVFTTGATVEECSYELLANGAESVYVATVATTMMGIE